MYFKPSWVLGLHPFWWSLLTSGRCLPRNPFLPFSPHCSRLLAQTLFLCGSHLLALGGRGLWIPAEGDKHFCMVVREIPKAVTFARLVLPSNGGVGRSSACAYICSFIHALIYSLEGVQNMSQWPKGYLELKISGNPQLQEEDFF